MCFQFPLLPNTGEEYTFFTIKNEVTMIQNVELGNKMGEGEGKKRQRLPTQVGK